MSNKPKKHNAFYYFMLDWRKEAEKCGLHFQNLKEVQMNPKCSQAWQSLSSDKKQRYYNLGKSKSSSMTKLNCRGESIELLKQKERKLAEFNREMRNYVSNIINDGLKNKELNKVKFYFLHFNWLYITNDCVYAPVEYAIGEFTLQDGIVKFHHKILNIKPKMGYAWESTETSRNSHKIHAEFSEGEKDFRRLYFELIDFLKPVKVGNKYPPFFVTKKIYDGVPSLLNQLAEAADCENTFLVYSIELLYTGLRNAALIMKGVDPILEIIAEKEFEIEKYAFERNIECDYHENIDGGSKYCSLALIRQWAYTICDYTCDGFGINYYPGRNCPAKMSKDYSYDEYENISSKSEQFDDAIKPSKNYRCKAFEKIEEEEEEEEDDGDYDDDDDNDEEDEDEDAEKKEEESAASSSSSSSSKSCEKENQIQKIHFSKIKEPQLSFSSPIKYERPLRLPNTPSLAVAVAGITNISNQIPNEDFNNLKIRIGRGRATMFSKYGSDKFGIGRGCGYFS